MKGPQVLSTAIVLEDSFSSTAKKVTRAVGDMQRGLDGLAGKLQEQVNSARMSAKEYDLYKAALMGASRAEKEKIASMHDLVSAQKQEIAAAEMAEQQKRAEQAISDRQQSEIKQTIALLERQRDALKYTTRELHLRMAAQNNASQSEIRHINNLHDGIDAMQKNGAAGRNLNGTLRLMRGGFGQVGHQIQDIAVQLQMGTNAMLVFGQQGGQIASLFGPKGAMIGAVLSVGAAVATYLAPRLFEGAKAVEELADKVEDAASKTKNLTKAQMEFLAVQYAKKLEEQREQVKELEVAMDGFAKRISLATETMKRVDQGSAEFEQAQNRLKDLDAQTKRSTAEIELLNSEMEDTGNKLRIMREGGNPFFEAGNGATNLKSRIEELNETIEEYKNSQLSASDQIQKTFYDDMIAISNAVDNHMITAAEGSRMMIDLHRKRNEDLKELENDRWQEEWELYSKGRQAQLKAEVDAFKEKNRLFEEYMDERDQLYKQATGLQESLLDEIELIRYNEQQKLDMIKQFEEEGLVLDMTYAEMRKRVAQETADAILAERLRSSDVSELDKAVLEGSKQRAEFEKKTERDKTAFVLGELDGQLAGLSKYSKKAFALQKAVQIAQAIMNTHTAATKALAAYPPPLGAVFAALAVANGMAQVAQIKAQSFEGGGFTGFGARAGGLDGKGGFPAILHPNETVIDHTKPGNKMSAPTINIVNNVDASGAGADVDQKIVAAMEVTSQQTVKQVQDLLRRQRLV